MFQGEIQSVNPDTLPARHQHVAEVHQTYSAIVSKLGEPSLEDPDPDKTIFEWAIRFRGDVFTVYDYDWQQPKPSKDEIRFQDAPVQWHIGSALPADSEQVQAFLCFLEQ